MDSLLGIVINYGTAAMDQQQCVGVTDKRHCGWCKVCSVSAYVADTVFLYVAIQPKARAAVATAYVRCYSSTKWIRACPVCIV